MKCVAVEMGVEGAETVDEVRFCSVDELTQSRQPCRPGVGVHIVKVISGRKPRDLVEQTPPRRLAAAREQALDPLTSDSGRPYRTRVLILEL